MVVSVMLDLETWGTEPGCDIRSIGACVFDPLTGGVGQHEADGRQWPVQANRTFYVACDNPMIAPYDADLPPVMLPPGIDDAFYDGVDAWRKYPLIRDARTVQWWSEQTDEAQGAFANPVDLREAVLEFAEWLYSASGIIDQYSMSSKPPINIRLWSHGPSFDPPILAAAYKAVGLPVPWHYRAPRDTRTAFDMAGVEDHSAWMQQFNTGTHHHALHDAIAQAKAVCAAYERVSNCRNHG